MFKVNNKETTTLLMFEIVNFEKVNTDWVGSHFMGKAVKPLSDMLA